MKKWNNPELLNLMLQETKTNTVGVEDGKTATKVEDHTCNDGGKHETWKGWYSGKLYCGAMHAMNDDGTCCPPTPSTPPTTVIS